MLGCRLEHGSTWIKWLFREVDGGEEGAGAKLRYGVGSTDPDDFIPVY
jgi:hypothetical protein